MQNVPEVSDTNRAGQTDKLVKTEIDKEVANKVKEEGQKENGYESLIQFIIHITEV